MSEPRYLVYGVVHRAERRMVYIGVTKRKLAKRWYEHCTQRTCILLSRAIQKHGRDAFAIIQLASAVGSANAGAVEAALVAQWNTMSPQGFNLTSGGEGTFERSAETKARMSTAFTGRVLSAEHRAKLSAWRKGKPLPAETRAKMGVKLRGKPQSPELRAKRAAAQIGRVMSPETRAKIGAANGVALRNKLPRSPEYLANQSAAIKAWWDQRRNQNNESD